jgi:hypothetical protein
MYDSITEGETARIEKVLRLKFRHRLAGGDSSLRSITRREWPWLERRKMTDSVTGPTKVFQQKDRHD